jgi:5,10-methenyltetrahydrofolate synthetase
MFIVPENADKSSIRKMCLRIRDSFSPSERVYYTNCISLRLLQTDEYKTAENVLLYVSIGSELDTNPLMEQALKDGKKLYYPRIKGDDLVFLQIKSTDELIPTGKYAIPEPTFTETSKVFDADTDSKTLILLPALAVDEKGFRLGYGKGFYDRYLAKVKRKQIVYNDKIFLVCGIYSALCTKRLPNETFDIPADMIITENEIINI